MCGAKRWESTPSHTRVRREAWLPGPFGLVASRAALWDPMRPRAEATRTVGLQVQTRADGQLAAGWVWRRQRVAHLGPGSRHGHGWLGEREIEPRRGCVRACAHFRHEASQVPASKGDTARCHTRLTKIRPERVRPAQVRPAKVRPAKVRRVQVRPGRGYLHGRIGQWGLDGWM